MATRSKNRADAALAAIDATLAADVVMCFCDCGQLVDEHSPSMYFASQRCSEFWHQSQAYPDPAAFRQQRRDLASSLQDQLGIIPDDPAPPRRRPLRVPQCYPGEVREWRELTRLQQEHWWRVQEMEERVSAAEQSTAWSRAQQRVARMVGRTAPPVLTGGHAALEDAGLLERLQCVQDETDRQLHELYRQQWSVTYVGGGALDDPRAGTTWRVDVGSLHEFVHIGPNVNHNQIVTACVERLRNQQLGRLE